MVVGVYFFVLFYYADDPDVRKCRGYQLLLSQLIGVSRSAGVGLLGIALGARARGVQM